MPSAPRALPAPTFTEKQWQAQVVAEARRFGFQVLWTHDSRHSPAGMPDLVLIHPQRRIVAFRELKTDRGKLGPEQRAVIDALAEAGADVAVWRPAQATEIWRWIAGSRVA